VVEDSARYDPFDLFCNPEIELWKAALPRSRLRGSLEHPRPAGGDEGEAIGCLSFFFSPSILGNDRWDEKVDPRSRMALSYQ
jgi:hypothetical protein